jgi:hypothetical protein
MIPFPDSPFSSCGKEGIWDFHALPFFHYLEGDTKCRLSL